MKKTYKLYGAILGDLAGQPYEFPPMQGPYNNVDLHNPNSHITDDTVMTLASAWDIMRGHTDIEGTYKYFAFRYPECGYGKGFKEWVTLRKGIQGTSYGNGCLMRASPYMYIKDGLPHLIKSVQCSHNHKDSLLATFRLWELYQRRITAKGFVLKNFTKFEVNSIATIDFCSMAADWNRTTHGNIVAAISCGGDTDTNASIVGELSNYTHKDISKQDAEYVESKLDRFQLDILLKFNKF